MALSADARHAGGRLLGVYGGRVHTIERAEGEATVHSSDLFHAVTAMEGQGVRYSLIMLCARAGAVAGLLRAPPPCCCCRCCC